MSQAILYLDSYGADEAADLRSHGVEVYEGTLHEIVRHPDAGTSTILRGPRLTPDDYARTAQILKGAGYTLNTSPAAYSLLATSDRYEAVLKEFVPDSVSFDLSDPTVEEKIAHLRWMDHAFIRSELGSVAKFDGVEACTISAFTAGEIADAISRIRSRFPLAHRLMVKRIEAIRKVAGRQLEGRAIVLGSSRVMVDHTALDDHADGGTFAELVHNAAATVAGRFAEAGCLGDFFVDIAQKERGGWFVVELKPLLNGTIRNRRSFAEALLSD